MPKLVWKNQLEQKASSGGRLPATEQALKPTAGRGVNVLYSIYSSTAVITSSMH